MPDPMTLVRDVPKVEQRAGCSYQQARAALCMCNGDVAAAIELARRLSPFAKMPSLPPSAEGLSMLYPACPERPKDFVMRQKLVRDITGASLNLAVNALIMCRFDAGEAARMIGADQ
jgi:hypothetical protein